MSKRDGRADDDRPSFETSLRAGIAIYNAGEYHAAHDAWEERWLGLERGTDDERFLHGLIQYTAAAHHASTRNWSGAVGLAESAASYLDGLPAVHRGVDLDRARSALAALGADPEVIERRPPDPLVIDGEPIHPGALDFGAAAIVARILAAADRYDAETVADAIRYARAELDEGTTRFISLVMDFAADAERRGLVYRRLSEHVERRRVKERDVADVFD
ncbi:DUF309 domain-containing protein [Haloferacaceae archaeon DSL9]